MNRDQNEDVEELKKIFWEQYPIDQYVRLDGNLVVKVLQAIDGLEDKCRAEGMWPY
jgi:hypothetical protein